MAIVWPAARIEAKACQGADVSTFLAIGGSPVWPR
jgi:hypothetical protein